MAGRLENGEWVVRSTWEKTADGAFRRQQSTFRDRIAPGGRFDVEPGRYHLYVSYACPWAHRTLITRALLGLEDAITASSVHPLMTDDGWHFDPDGPEHVTPDPLFGERFFRDIYLRADPEFTGRVTVPVLWDRQEQTIVNNESRDIIEMMATALRPLATRSVDLYPASLQADIDGAMDRFYTPINNGVYRCGFAGTQAAYETAYRELFAALDHWEAILERQRFLVGDALTLADIAMFPTLYRFDPVYVVHFKTNNRRIQDYPNLWGFVRDVHAHHGVAETCRLDQVKEHYYRSHPQLNPRGFVPPGPVIDYTVPTDRAERDWG